MSDKYIDDLLLNHCKVKYSGKSCGQTYGHYKVVKPIIAYKKVGCKYIGKHGIITNTLENMSNSDIKTAIHSREYTIVDDLIEYETLCEQTAIVKLIIPTYAQIIRPMTQEWHYQNSYKFRTDMAIVEDIYLTCSDEKFDDKKYWCYSMHDPSFFYKIGQLITPKCKFNDNIAITCASGIHIFLTEEEAIYYNY
ncbi:hypothetical protein QLL95_gp1151 [Cotonvirus japonicus]|uniref:Uncharacterized protein n=1 Tax=Cotonvirus japonicus TaxID=2811091 RepID=A0ABM7NS36_9VIRU|nr:hypothetical protein QLL95_gp1151 [Cotonvirus japonicus]BCS82972.1 hypothetical protein [Cotonvirus japonicus]